MAHSRLALHVLCTNAGVSGKWDTIRASYEDLQVNQLVSDCAIETIRRISQSSNRPFLVCREETWLGRGIAGHVQSLVEELCARFPNWALCGNRGVSCDGRLIYDYAHDIVSGGLQTAVCAHPVISVADDILLVNPNVLNRHIHLAPAIRGHCGVLLSLECLSNGSIMVVSPHLMTLRDSGPEREDENAQALDSDPRFAAYYRALFLNHYLPTSDGTIDLSGLVDYRYLTDPRKQSSQADLLDLYDQCLAPSFAIARPSLTICCRTQFRRPEMLDRAVMSFAAFRQQASGLADVQVRLISDARPEVASPALRCLQETHPGASLEFWSHDVRPPRFSRTDLMLAAVERARTDYIWFVDDDDFVNAAVAPALARCLVVDAPLLIVASASIVQETWSGENGAPEEEVQARELLRYERSSSFQAAHLYRVLRGRNFIPNCGMIFPVRLMQQRIATVDALGDYNEDYFLLLLALTAARIEVRLLDYELSSVSMRGGENTVAQEDRTEWHLSMATFLLEILNRQGENSPFLWQLGNAPRW